MSFDPNTGTRRVSLSREIEGGQHGDYAVGGHYVSAVYVSDDGYMVAEIDLYVEKRELDGIDCDGFPYSVVECATIGLTVQEDGYVRPDDAAEISYEYPFPVDFRTLEEAQEAADKQGHIDLSFALNMRKRDNERTAA